MSTMWYRRMSIVSTSHIDARISNDIDNLRRSYTISIPSVNIFVFFFQAEDGIRDYKVTGVQTCALPICLCSCFAYTFIHFAISAHLRHVACVSLLFLCLFVYNLVQQHSECCLQSQLLLAPLQPQQVGISPLWLHLQVCLTYCTQVTSRQPNRKHNHHSEFSPFVASAHRLRRTFCSLTGSTTTLINITMAEGKAMHPDIAFCASSQR